MTELFSTQESVRVSKSKPQAAEEEALSPQVASLILPAQGPRGQCSCSGKSRARPHTKYAIWPVCVLFLVSRCHSAKSSHGSPARDGQPELLGSLHERLQGGLRAGFQSRPAQAQGRARCGQGWRRLKGAQEPNKLGFRNPAPPFTSGLTVGARPLQGSAGTMNAMYQHCYLHTVGAQEMTLPIVIRISCGDAVLRV